MNLLDGYPVVVEFPVAWGEMDANRHVNSMVYFRYFENARVEYFRRLDWYGLERETGVGPVLAATEARYCRPLAFPDRVSVGARVTAVDADRFAMEYCVVSHELGAVATLGRATVMAFDYPAGKKAPLPEELKRRINQVEAAANSRLKTAHA